MVITSHLHMLVVTPPAAVTPPVDDRGVDVLAADGSIIRIRPASPTDAAALTALHEQASDQSLYRRFFGAGRAGIGAEIARLVRPADATHVTLVAADGAGLLGVCSYEVLPEGTAAEFAIFVGDGAHDRGVGTLLLEHLIVQARRHAVAELVGEVLSANTPMLRLANALGQPIRSHTDRDTVDMRIATGTPDTDVMDLRDLTAAGRSLTPVLAPRCIAVVGAGRAPGGVGHSVLNAIAAGGFTGTLYAVNPAADEIAGVAAYPSIAAGPVTPDLVVIAVPAAKVADVLTEAATAGARAAVVLSSGFGEDGPHGLARQRELVRIARTAGMRLVGPNCLGVINTDPAIRLHASFGAAAPAGGLAIASQSGAVGISLLEHATAAGIGVSSFVSLGNKADVSGNDLLSYWYADPAAKVVALYLESLGNPRRFARIARAVSRRKPVLVVKSGRTVTGSRAGASHTAAAAAPDATVDALFAQAGVVRCNGLRDLIDTARMLTDQPLPAGGRIAILGNAGGINVLAADAADAAGLTLPTLSDQAQAAIRAAAPDAAATSNPVDLGAAANAAAIDAAMRTVASEVDAVVIAFAATLAADVPAIVAQIGATADAIAIPAAIVLLGVPDAPTTLGRRNVPVYQLPEDAIGALGRAVQYATSRHTPQGRRPELTGIDAAAGRHLIELALAAGGGWQTPQLGAELLACYGIHPAPAQDTDAEDTAVAAAQALGYPVVLKSANPNLVHKSDIGAVRLGLPDAAAVRQAYQDVVAATGDQRVLVQTQVTSGVELVAGIVHDPLFGSVLICGLGGTSTDLLGDRSLRLLPLTDLDAARMWRTLRGAPLLTGYRGAVPTNTDAVEDLLLRLGRLAEDLPEIAELDCNPIIVTPEGVNVVDVKLRLAPVGSEPDPALRSLREPT